MTEIQCPSFSETVVCEMDGEYKIAQGWNTSTGQGGRFPYTPPAGWEYDARYSDIRDPSLGTHGGCSDCIMTCIHLISCDPIITEPIPEPARSFPIIILIIGSYILYKLMK